MKSHPVISILISIGLAMTVFGWWGLETEAGRSRFDEMAGMIPWFVGLAGMAMIGGCALFVVARAVLKRRNSNRSGHSDG